MDNTDVVLMLGYCEIMNMVYKNARETREFDPLTVAVIGFDFTAGCGDPNINMDGFWYVANKVSTNDETLNDFYSDFDNGKWDFTPYVDFPYGNAIPDSAHGEEFKTAMGGEVYTAEPNSFTMEKDYSGYIYDSIILFLKAMDTLLTDTGIDYFADDTPDLTLGLANAYIRSTVLNDGITGVVSLDAKGERRGEVSIRSIKHNATSYEEVEIATFSPVDTTSPLTWEVEQNEIVWAFGETTGQADDSDDGENFTFGNTASFKIGISLITAAVTVTVTILLYKVRKNAAVSQIDAAKEMKDAAKQLKRIGSENSGRSRKDNEEYKKMSVRTMEINRKELLLEHEKLNLEMDRLQVASAARTVEIKAKLPVEMEKYKPTAKVSEKVSDSPI